MVAYAPVSKVYGATTVTPTLQKGGPAVYVFGRTDDSLPTTLTLSANTPVGVTGLSATQTSTHGVTYRAIAELTVTAKPITVAAADQTRGYGDANGAFTYMLSDSLVAGDSIGGALTSAATATSGVGGYDITQGTLSLGANYAVTFVPATLTVTPRPFTITARSSIRNVGRPNPPFTYTTSGTLVGGDTVTGTLAAAATAESAEGNYVIAQGTLSFGAASSNYNLTFNPGTLTIVPLSVRLFQPPVPITEQSYLQVVKTSQDAQRKLRVENVRIAVPQPESLKLKVELPSLEPELASLNDTETTR